MTQAAPPRTYKILPLVAAFAGGPRRLSAALALGLLLVTQAALAIDGKASKFYEDALQRFERRDLDGAIIQLKNALQVDKTLLPAHVLLGKALLGKGDAITAEFELNEALRLGVSRAEVVVPLARTLMAQGKQAQLLDDSRLKTVGLPAGVMQELMLVRASAAADTGDVRGAMSQIEQARAIDPAQLASWLAEVPIRIRSAQFREALAAVDHALKLNPEAADALYQKGSVLHVQGRIVEAQKWYEQALRVDSGHLEARLAHAGIMLDLGQDKQAQADVAELKMLDPFEPRVSYLAALLAERSGDSASAKASLKEVTEMLDPIAVEVLRYRPQALMLNGLAHFGLNEFEKAKPYLEYAQRQTPGSPLSKVLAQIALADGNNARAIDLLDSYLKLRPGDGQAMLMLASAQMALGRHGKAAALMQEALRSKDAPEYRTALGLSLMRGGQDASAIAELEKSFAASPKQTYAGLALVNLYLRSGQVGKAQQVSTKLVKAEPDNAVAQLMHATTLSSAADFAGARTAYERALKVDPKLLEAKLGLARIDIRTRAFDAARDRLGLLIRENDRNADALFEMAVLYEAWGKNDEAIRWLDSAVEASGSAQTRANYAQVAWHLKKGQPSKALDAAKLLLAKMPDDVNALQTYAQAQLANKDLAGARSTLTNASRRAAFDAPAQVEIARLQLAAKDLAGAAYSLDKALSAQPAYLPAMVLMTGVELRRGDAAKAERRAQLIVQSQPKLAVGHGLLADIAMSRGQTAAAVDALRRAHELEPSSQTLLRLFHAKAMQGGGKPDFELARRWLKSHPGDLVVEKALADALARSGNFPEARSAYEAALKQHPSDAELLNNLANVLMRQNDPAAVGVAEKALAQDPRSANLIDTAGWANHLAGNRDRALQLLRDARLRQPGNPEIRYHLAVVLVQAGRRGEARDELQAALKRGAEFEGAPEARKLLETLK